MEMFFQVVEDGLNLGPPSEQLPLTFSHHLLLLPVMRWGEDTRAKDASYLFVQRFAAVAGVANSDLGMLIHKHWDSPAVVDVGAGESHCTEPSVVVDGRVQFEAVVFALSVIPGMSEAPGDPMPPSPNELADLAAWWHPGNAGLPCL